MQKKKTNRSILRVTTIGRISREEKKRNRDASKTVKIRLISPDEYRLAADAVARSQKARKIQRVMVRKAVYATKRKSRSIAIKEIIYNALRRSKKPSGT